MPDGQVLAGRYELGGVLGRGGMAEVRRARDTRLGRDVAVKLFRGAAADRERFDGEMRLLAGLRHPALLALHDGGEEDGTPFLVLELAGGPTLAERLRRGPLDPGEVEALVTTLAAALEHLHERGIVHRDLKPSNVLGTDDGRWLLGDFGIARLVDATGLTATGTTVGTPAYLAPEQLQGRSVGPEADVYALGLVAIEALTGVAAFPGPRNEAALARLTTDPPVATVVDPRWRALLGRMTARDPAERPTAAEVLAAVPSDTTEVAGTPATVPMPVRPSSGSPPRALIGVVVVLAVVLAGVLVARALDGDGEPADSSVAAAPVTTTTAVPVTTTVPVTAPPPTAPPPPTAEPSADCAGLRAQRDAIEEQKRALHADHSLDHEARRERDEALKEQKRTVDEALRAAGC